MDACTDIGSLMLLCLLLSELSIFTRVKGGVAKITTALLKHLWVVYCLGSYYFLQGSFGMLSETGNCVME